MAQNSRHARPRAKSRVAVLRVSPRANEQELRLSIERALDLLGGIGTIIPAGSSVLVKPNFGTALAKMSVNPSAVSAALSFFSEQGYPTSIGEDPVGCFTEKQVYQRWRLAEMAKRCGAELVSIRHGPQAIARIPKPLYFGMIKISRHALKADAVVSLAKLKSIPLCQVSLSLKNMKGLIPDAWKRRFHCEGLERGIVDLNRAVRPKLAIIDGTTAYDMVANKVQPTGVIIVSADCVAADAVGAAIMGYDPRTISHITLAEKVGLGTARLRNIQIVGEPLKGLAGAFEFSRPSSPFAIAREHGITIVQGSPCSSCLNELGRELAGYRGDLSQFKGTAILVGTRARPPAKDGTVILYGNCTKRHAAEGVFVRGCPPNYVPAGTGSLAEALKQVKRKRKSISH